MLPLNNDTSDTDQSIEMVRFQCGPGSPGMLVGLIFYLIGRN